MKWFFINGELQWFLNVRASVDNLRVCSRLSRILLFCNVMKALQKRSILDNLLQNRRISTEALTFKKH